MNFKKDFNNFYNKYINIKNDVKSYNSIIISHNKQKYSEKYKSYVKLINNSISNFINNFYFIDLNYSNVFYI